MKLPAEETFKLVSEAAAARPDSYAMDLRWALERLSRNGAIRINSGSDEHPGADGNLWGKDRFAVGGKVCTAPSDRPVEGTEDGELYRTARTFPQDLPGGYRIPLPLGRYRVTLAFSELYFREAGKRRFDVLLEGKRLLEDYEPKVDTAENFTFEQSVEDGHLDLEFVRKVDNPGISAIAIERLP